jgi:Phosphoribosylaminoimidazole carboxylase (NCAIR synthetase)
MVSYRLGIIGGGQLAKMTAMAALQLGCDVVVLEKRPTVRPPPLQLTLWWAIGTRLMNCTGSRLMLMW